MTASAATPAWQPNRNVEIIVSTSAGSGSDTTARFIQKVLVEKKLVEAPVTVTNKPGGQGTIGLTYLIQHPGNGHYLLITSPSFLANHIMGRTPVHFSETTPLAQLGTEPVLFTVRAASPFKTGRDLAEWLKTNPDSVSFSIGTTIGSHNHIAVALLAKAVGANPKPLKVLSFAGSADGITALLGGHITVAAAPASGVWEHVVAGKLRTIAAAAETRLSGPLANVPTWKELGYPSVVSMNWRSVVGAKGIPEAEVRYWNRVFGSLSRSPEWKQSLQSEHMEDTYSDSRGTRELMDVQYNVMSATLADLGLVK